jgi:hypothetical protein
MERYITNPQDYSVKDLRNHDWDLIKLNVTFDVEPLLAYFNDLKTIHLDSLWTTDKTEYCRPEMDLNQPKFEGGDYGRGGSGYWTLQWPVQRKDPIPGPIFCRRDLYPELLDEQWDTKMNRHLDHYYYGAYKSFVEQIGQDAWSWGRAMVVGKDQGIGPHLDAEDHFVIRMHVNVKTSPECTWNFFSQLGETPLKTWPYKDKVYHPLTGEIILVNVAKVHSPVNYGDEEWFLFHSNPSDEAVDRLLKSQQHIKLQ